MMDVLGRPVLVPLDGSPLAEHALPTAERFTTALDGELLLVRVTPLALIPFELSGGAVSAQVYQRLADDEIQFANAYLARIAEASRSRGLCVHTVVQRGEPASTLLDIESAMNVGMVVMTTHGRTGVVRFALGSTADRLVRHGNEPVLLLRPVVASAQDETFAHVIVPLDGSALGASALQVAAPLAGRLLRHITLLRAVPANASAQEASQAERELSIARAQLIAELAGRSCLVDVSVVRGAADEQIIEQAQAKRTPVIMATHGLTGIRRWSYGSIADHVLHEADVPVLLVHPPLPKLPPILEQIQSGQH